MGAHVLHQCNEASCFVCEGGLALCEVCGGAEGAMPTDCPGERMSTEIADQVMRGEFDFVGGRWVNKMTLDISKLPPGVDWIIGYTNGGLTIHAQVGPLKECFGDTPQQALDAAIAQWEQSERLRAKGVSVKLPSYWYHPESDSYFTCEPGEDWIAADLLAHEIDQVDYEAGLARQQKAASEADDGLLV